MAVLHKEGLEQATKYLERTKLNCFFFSRNFAMGKLTVVMRKEAQSIYLMATILDEFAEFRIDHTIDGFRIFRVAATNQHSILKSYFGEKLTNYVTKEIENRQKPKDGFYDKRQNGKIYFEKCQKFLISHEENMSLSAKISLQINFAKRLREYNIKLFIKR